jgi:hypothetical protein
MIKPRTIEEAVYVLYRLLTESADEGDQLLKDILTLMLNRSLQLDELQYAKDELARLFIRNDALL